MKKLILILFVLFSLQTIAQTNEQTITDKGHFYVGLGFNKLGTLIFIPAIKTPYKLTVLQVNMHYTKNKWNVGTQFGIHSFGINVTRQIF